APSPVPGGLAVSRVTVLRGPAAEPIDAGESSLPAGRGDVPVVSGWRRLMNLGAAGGCFALSIIGFITPRLPTAPFVLAARWFLVRSPPALSERLRRSALFGQMVRDFEDHGGMTAAMKTRTLLMMCGMMGITVVLAGPSLSVLSMTAAVA